MYEQVFIPTEIDLAYAAGIVDGEGCISMTDKISNGDRKHFSTHVGVGNTNRNLMAWLELNFGGNSSVRPRTGNNKDYYYWVIYGHKAKDFLKQILPYLKLKQRQAEIAIEFQSNIFAGRNQHNSYTESELAIKEAQVILMHQLNKKGKECVNVSS